jgi:hypothetical protein
MDERRRRYVQSLRDEDDKAVKRIAVGFGLWAAFCLTVSLTVLGVILWAVIRLVLHFT